MQIKFHGQITAAKTQDEELVARYELWLVERQEIWRLNQLEEIKRETALKCPGGICQRPEDLPLWEAEQLRLELGWKRDEVERQREVVPRSPEEIPESGDYQLVRLERAERDLDIHETAYAASRGDAERLRPGVSFEEATGQVLERGDGSFLDHIARQKDNVQRVASDLAEIQEWAEDLPPRAVKARERVQYDIDRLEGQIKSGREGVRWSEKWLAEHPDDL